MRVGLLIAMLLAAASAPAMAAEAVAPTSGSLAPQDASSCPVSDRSNPASPGPCVFNRTTLSFQGTPVEQAKCLLRRVKIGGNVDQSPLAALPTPLDVLVGKPVGVTAAELRTYLQSKNIDEAGIGGPLARPLSTGRNNAAGAPRARYFVIHDTSFPNHNMPNLPGPLPDNATINDASWTHNDLTTWQKGCGSLAHVYIARTGQSLTTVQFETAWRATRLELRYVGPPSMGIFLHIESVQPREHDSAPGQTAENDRKAPTPGFSQPQLARLALVYVAASVRRGEWLIPAFHAAIDDGIPGGHDDPQNFVLREWACKVHDVLVSLGKRSGTCS